MADAAQGKGGWHRLYGGRRPPYLCVKQLLHGSSPFFLLHRGCPLASITQKRPNHGQVSVHGERKFIEGQQPYVK